jgi:hypothetical protein
MTRYRVPHPGPHPGPVLPSWPASGARPVPLQLRLGAAYALILLGTSCDFDLGTRWLAPEPKPPVPPLCQLDDERCIGALERCVEGDDGAAWVVIDDCPAQGLVCAPTLLECTECLPDERFCDGFDVMLCDSQGAGASFVETCDATLGEACRSGGCPNLCARAQEEKSNVGCEYWAVDLDNAMISEAKNASGQQFAVVVSNPQPDVGVAVQIYQDDGQPGDAPAPVEIAQVTIAPLNLRVFKLGPREVDGSPDGEFNTGSHTAHSRAAYKVTSDFPVVAYQFNPLENVNVFSNDASLLKPREALTFDSTGPTLSYVVAGWPQTIAATDDPNTNFNAASPINLKVFLTIVGTQSDTQIIVEPTTKIMGGGGIPETNIGGKLEMTIDAFDVVNLETPDLNAFAADFTGSTIESDKPIAVFVGGEASDAPRFSDLKERRCCADHLEEQLDPVRTAGKKFALAHSPSRSRTVLEAGGVLGIAPEPEFFRFVSTIRYASTVITTTLPPPDDSFELHGLGDWHEVSTPRDFIAESDQPIHVIQVMASQDAANVPRGLPGGDPSLLVVPPREQYRNDYVFLTPDKYAFDFVTIVAAPEATVVLDEAVVDGQRCTITPTDGLTEEERGDRPLELITYTCQLSFATIEAATGTVLPGQQNDGVHRLTSSYPLGVTVFGFDAYVSYAYAAGTELREIAPPR